MYESDIDLVHLQKELAKHFDLSELKGLCFDLKIGYEEIAGETLTDKSRELVKFCYRIGRIPDLVKKCHESRPTVSWSQRDKIYRQDELPEEWVEPLQRLHRLVKKFNRNRYMPFSEDRTRQGDEIAFAMREAAPFLFGQFDLKEWLGSGNAGKRLAAIKYLDWLQDIEFLNDLLLKLVTESPFIQFHILVALDSMLDQLDNKHRKIVQMALTPYQLSAAGDSEREFWRSRILSKIKAAEGGRPL